MNTFRDPPAHKLLHRTLATGWVVERRFDPAPGATGGAFSVNYWARHTDGRLGFLKALDVPGAFFSDDPMRMLQLVTSMYNFERDLLNVCNSQRMNRVVRAIDDGVEVLDATQPWENVPYLVFERADCDARRQLDQLKTLDCVWALRALHHIATGLKQLHAASIAHQDLKPSNVLFFDNGQSSKIGDLGRAVQKDVMSPHAHATIAGDKSYAPPEALYGHVEPDWLRHRVACDAYHFGSLIVYFFTRATMNALLKKHLAPEHDWNQWQGTYKEVLPYLSRAFADALEDVRRDLPPQIRDSMIALIVQLCDPDLANRGNQSSTPGQNPTHSFERYVTQLDLLAKRAEVTFAKDAGR